jgi:hypothetical protein
LPSGLQASEDKCSQKEIGDIASVADATIHQSYKLVYPHAAKLFPADFKFATPIDQLPQMLDTRILAVEILKFYHKNTSITTKIHDQ